MFNFFKKKKSHAEEVQEELLRELEEEKAKENQTQSFDYADSFNSSFDSTGNDLKYDSDSDNNKDYSNIDMNSLNSEHYNDTNDKEYSNVDAHGLNNEPNNELNIEPNDAGNDNDDADIKNQEADETFFLNNISINNTTVDSQSQNDDNCGEIITDEMESDIKEEIQSQTPKGFFAKLKEGLTKTRNNIVSGMDSLFLSDEKIDDDFYDELEEILILGDIGVHTTEDILEKLKSEVKHNHIRKRTDCKAFLIQSIKEAMAIGETAYEFENTKSVVFVIGVNGVGKTTSIGKLAALLKVDGKRVMLGACDTFRAAAGSQLEEWSHRAGVEMIGGKEGQDPSSVLYDAVSAAKARNVDVLLVDTAGRLHNKKNLMEELKKMNRVIDKVYPEVHRENLIVLDASTGQNALNQAKEFGEVADLTGIILTKMDGTAKGGIAIAITSELQVPVKYIGVGERIVDLQKFNPDSFVDALFDVELSDDSIIDSYKINNSESIEELSEDK